VDYWNFVRGSDFAETIARAQLVSFLVTYGYANLQRKGSSLLLVPKARPDPHTEGSPLSFPIPITKEVLIRARLRTNQPPTMKRSSEQRACHSPYGEQYRVPDRGSCNRV